MLTRAAARVTRAEVQQPAAVAALTTGAPVAAGQTQLQVQHDTDGCELFIEMPDCNDRAYLQYERGPDGMLDLQHTVVPEAFRGRGVAKILAKAAFDFVVEQDTNMKLTCWYLQKYIKDNPSSEHVSRVIQ